MKSIIIPFGLMTVLLLGACATTPPQPRTFDQLGQFNHYPLNQNSFRISFKASPNMSFGTAEEITLLKAAQTTVQQGFIFFKVLDDPSNRSQQPPRQAVVYQAPMYNPFYYGYHRSGRFYDPFYQYPQVVNIEPTQVAYTIGCYREKDKMPADAFDARLILQSLGQKYGLGPTGEVLPPAQTEVISKQK